jgi:hypothetical protein
MSSGASWQAHLALASDTLAGLQGAGQAAGGRGRRPEGQKGSEVAGKDSRLVGGPTQPASQGWQFHTHKQAARRSRTIFGGHKAVQGKARQRNAGQYSAGQYSRSPGTWPPHLPRQP